MNVSKFVNPKNMVFFTEIHRFKTDFEKLAHHFSEFLVLPSPQIRSCFRKNMAHLWKKIGAWRLFQVRSKERNVFQLYLHSSLQNNQTFHVYPTRPINRIFVTSSPHQLSRHGLPIQEANLGSDLVVASGEEFFQQTSLVFVQAFGFIGHSSQIWT